MEENKYKYEDYLEKYYEYKDIHNTPIKYYDIGVSENKYEVFLKEKENLLDSYRTASEEERKRIELAIEKWFKEEYRNDKSALDDIEKYKNPRKNEVLINLERDFHNEEIVDDDCKGFLDYYLRKGYEYTNIQAALASYNELLDKLEYKKNAKKVLDHHFYPDYDLDITKKQEKLLNYVKNLYDFSNYKLHHDLGWDSLDQSTKLDWYFGFLSLDPEYLAIINFYSKNKVLGPRNAKAQFNKLDMNQQTNYSLEILDVLKTTTESDFLESLEILDVLKTTTESDFLESLEDHNSEIDDVEVDDLDVITLGSYLKHYYKLKNSDNTNDNWLQITKDDLKDLYKSFKSLSSKTQGLVNFYSKNETTKIQDIRTRFNALDNFEQSLEELEVLEVLENTNSESINIIYTRLVEVVSDFEDDIPPQNAFDEPKDPEKLLSYVMSFYKLKNHNLDWDSLPQSTKIVWYNKLLSLSFQNKAIINFYSKNQHLDTKVVKTQFYKESRVQQTLDSLEIQDVLENTNESDFLEAVEDNFPLMYYPKVVGKYEDEQEIKENTTIPSTVSLKEAASDSEDDIPLEEFIRHRDHPEKVLLNTTEQEIKENTTSTVSLKKSASDPHLEKLASTELKNIHDLSKTKNLIKKIKKNYNYL